MTDSTSTDDKPPSLGSARLKRERAAELWRALSEEVLHFFRVEDVFPFVIDGEFDRDAHLYRLYARLQIEIPVERWGIVVGDFAHNARSALDHAAWALATARGLTGRNENTDRRIQFPITDTREAFDRAIKRLPGLPDADVAMLESLQPYHSADFPARMTLPRPLATLRDMSNTDKHRSVHIAIASLIPLPEALPAFRDSPEAYYPRNNDAGEVIQITTYRPELAREPRLVADVLLAPTGPDPRVGLFGPIPTALFTAEQFPLAGFLDILHDVTACLDAVERGL